MRPGPAQAMPVHSESHGPDAEALERMLAAKPVWSALAPAREVIALPDRVVLHAGPPIDGKPCAPIRNSAAMAVLFEGWAAKESDAFAMIDNGEVALRPAQEKALASFMPASSRVLGATVMAVDDPRFLDGVTIRTGLLAAHVVAAGTGPAVSLGIIHKTGHAGRTGGGIFTSPLELFALAGKALRKSG